MLQKVPTNRPIYGIQCSSTHNQCSMAAEEEVVTGAGNLLQKVISNRRPRLQLLCQTTHVNRCNELVLLFPSPYSTYDEQLTSWLLCPVLEFTVWRARSRPLRAAPRLFHGCECNCSEREVNTRGIGWYPEVDVDEPSNGPQVLHVCRLVHRQTIGPKECFAMHWCLVSRSLQASTRSHSLT